MCSRVCARPLGDLGPPATLGVLSVRVLPPRGSWAGVRPLPQRNASCLHQVSIHKPKWRLYRKICATPVGEIVGGRGLWEGIQNTRPC